MIDNQKISGLYSILDELFDSFRPVPSIAHPEFIHPNAFFECILGYKHLERLKAEYEKIKKE